MVRTRKIRTIRIRSKQFVNFYLLLACRIYGFKLGLLLQGLFI
uniref:Uncharacterized protein n=1 Tax=Rhizophora mucronata TaxID=61149 RepID=A0A2P2R526_RHIMU